MNLTFKHRLKDCKLRKGEILFTFYYERISKYEQYHLFLLHLRFADFYNTFIISFSPIKYSFSPTSIIFFIKIWDMDSGFEITSVLHEIRELSDNFVFEFLLSYLFASFFSKNPSKILILPIWYPFLTKSKKLYYFGIYLAIWADLYFWW